MDELLGDNSIQIAADRSAPGASTITAALEGGPATCAAIVAAALALTEDLGDPFQAVVLERHVVLGSRAEPGRYYELLESGLEIAELDLRSHSTVQGIGPQRVDGAHYVAYYLDNLAARLAEVGDVQAATDAFESALAIAPAAARILYNYGSFLVGVERFSDGLEYLDQAIQAGWSNASAFVNHGVANWRLGNIDGARIDFDRAINLDPTHQAAILNRRLLAEDSKAEIPMPETRK